MDFVVLLFISADFLLLMSLIDARSCFFPGEGEKKFYICTKNEYCCSYGCCLSPSFQFYQLWYYWLMVIFMFLLCSGGGWWYRYWLHERYPSEFTNSIHSHQVGRQCPRPYRPARITYHPARETIILHHVWKGPDHAHAAAMRARSPPPYHPNDGAPIVSNGVPLSSPYHQIYGPPPSYDSVVAGTSGFTEVEPTQVAGGNSVSNLTRIPGLQNSVSRILTGVARKGNSEQFFEAPPPIDAAGTSLYMVESATRSSSRRNSATESVSFMSENPAKYANTKCTLAVSASHNKEVDGLADSVYGDDLSVAAGENVSPRPITSSEFKDQSHETRVTKCPKNPSSPNKPNKYFCSLNSFRHVSSREDRESLQSVQCDESLHCPAEASTSLSSQYRDNVIATPSTSSPQIPHSFVSHRTEGSSLYQSRVCVPSMEETGLSCQISRDSIDPSLERK